MNLDGKMIWLILVSLVTVAQALLLTLKILRDKNDRKKTGAGPCYHDRIKTLEDEMHNPSYGERLGILETEMENLKERNSDDHSLIRKDVQKLFTLFNGIRDKG